MNLTVTHGISMELTHSDNPFLWRVLLRNFHGSKLGHDLSNRFMIFYCIQIIASLFRGNFLLDIKGELLLSLPLVEITTDDDILALSYSGLVSGG